jgi:hypothetical protein
VSSRDWTTVENKAALVLAAVAVVQQMATPEPLTVRPPTAQEQVVKRQEFPQASLIDALHERGARREAMEEAGRTIPKAQTTERVVDPPNVLKQVTEIIEKYDAEVGQLRSERDEAIAKQAAVDNARIRRMEDKLGVNITEEGRKNLEAGAKANADQIRVKFEQAEKDLNQRRQEELTVAAGTAPSRKDPPGKDDRK